jgi:excisionase family DNA binding protein
MARFGYLTRQEIAERYGVSVGWVAAQTRNGALAHIRFSHNEVLVKPEDFEAFIETLRVPARVPVDAEDPTGDEGPLGS